MVRVEGTRCGHPGEPAAARARTQVLPIAAMHIGS